VDAPLGPKLFLTRRSTGRRAGFADIAVRLAVAWKLPIVFVAGRRSAWARSTRRHDRPIQALWTAGRWHLGPTDRLVANHG